MKQQILSVLQRIEKEHGVSILFAVESGSRAWGFASADSDYDVRFVYKRPVRDYVRVNDFRDVIEEPIVDEYDVNGWDLLKAVRLLHKSNPSLMEWLHSPVVYLERGTFAVQLREVVEKQYSLYRLAVHYLNMAKANYRTHLQGKSEVNLKKYLYVLRPLLCTRWLEQHRNTLPTSIWTALKEIDLPADVRISLVELLHRKLKADELEVGPPHPTLEGFIRTELERMPDIIPRMPNRTLPESSLDELVWRVLGI